MSQFSQRFPQAARSDFYCCYTLRSLNPDFVSSTYIGFTTNPRRRLRQHNGELTNGARETSNRRPWEMLGCVYGFPNQVTALKFEWAWQHARRSRHTRDALAGRSLPNGARGVVLLLMLMLRTRPWSRLPLHVRFTSDAAASLCAGMPDPPAHVTVSVGALESLPCYGSSAGDGALSGDSDNDGDGADIDFDAGLGEDGVAGGDDGDVDFELLGSVDADGGAPLAFNAPLSQVYSQQLDADLAADFAPTQGAGQGPWQPHQGSQFVQPAPRQRNPPATIPSHPLGSQAGADSLVARALARAHSRVLSAAGTIATTAGPGGIDSQSDDGGGAAAYARAEPPQLPLSQLSDDLFGAPLGSFALAQPRPPPLPPAAGRVFGPAPGPASAPAPAAATISASEPDPLSAGVASVHVGAAPQRFAFNSRAGADAEASSDSDSVSEIVSTAGAGAAAGVGAAAPASELDRWLASLSQAPAPARATTGHLAGGGFSQAPPLGPASAPAATSAAAPAVAVPRTCAVPPGVPPRSTLSQQAQGPARSASAAADSSVGGAADVAAAAAAQAATAALPELVRAAATVVLKLLRASAGAGAADAAAPPSACCALCAEPAPILRPPLPAPLLGAPGDAAVACLLMSVTPPAEAPLVSLPPPQHALPPRRLAACPHCRGRFHLVCLARALAHAAANALPAGGGGALIPALSAGAGSADGGAGMVSKRVAAGAFKPGPPELSSPHQQRRCAGPCRAPLLPVAGACPLPMCGRPLMWPNVVAASQAAAARRLAAYDAAVKVLRRHAIAAARATCAPPASATAAGARAGAKLKRAVSATGLGGGRKRAPAALLRGTSNAGAGVSRAAPAFPTFSGLSTVNENDEEGSGDGFVATQPVMW